MMPTGLGRGSQRPSDVSSLSKARYAFFMRSILSPEGQVTVPVEVREHLGLVPGTPIDFEIREEGVLLRKGTSGSHPVDKVWATLRPIPDLALLESLEDRADIEEAQEALREAQEKGTTSLADLKAELGF